MSRPPQHDATAREAQRQTNAKTMQCDLQNRFPNRSLAFPHTMAKWGFRDAGRLCPHLSFRAPGYPLNLYTYTYIYTQEHIFTR